MSHRRNDTHSPVAHDLRDHARHAGSRRPGRSLPRHLLVRLGLILAGGLLGSLLAELGASLLLPAPPPMRQPQLVHQLDPELGHVLPAETDAWCYDGHVTTDRHGLRVTPPERATSNGPVIAAVGDSFTFGFAVSDEQTYPAHLQAILDEAEPDRQARVVNLGVNAYDPHQEILHFARHAPRIHPDLVIVGLYVNDIEIPPRPLPERRKATPDRTSGLLFQLAQRSRLLNLLWDGWISWRGRHSRMSRILAGESPEEVAPARWAALEQVIERWVTLARQMPFRLLVVVFPHVRDLRPRSPLAFQKAVARLCKRHDVDLVDLTASLRDATTAGEPIFRPYVDHLTSRGNAIVAREIHGYVARWLIP